MARVSNGPGIRPRNAGSGRVIPKTDWKWFGNAGHLCVSQWCRFHLATQIGPWFVSTVGEYVHPRHGKGSDQAESEWLKNNGPGEDIGCDRKYETMVFKAGKPCECGCGMPVPKDFTELDSNGYNDAASATKGHMAMCDKYAGVTDD